MSDKPFLSMFCICGDAGAKTLGRMLKSVLHRADGTLVERKGRRGAEGRALRVGCRHRPWACPAEEAR